MSRIVELIKTIGMGEIVILASAIGFFLGPRRLPLKGVMITSIIFSIIWCMAAVYVVYIK